MPDVTLWYAPRETGYSERLEKRCAASFVRRSKRPAKELAVSYAGGRRARPIEHATGTRATSRTHPCAQTRGLSWAKPPYLRLAAPSWASPSEARALPHDVRVPLEPFAITSAHGLERRVSCPRRRGGRLSGHLKNSGTNLMLQKVLRGVDERRRLRGCP